MRKAEKWTLACAGALLLATAWTSAAFAFTGWVEDADGTMMYLNKSGERVTDTWMRRGSSMCYLDENGIVAKDQFVEYNGDDCYVDETGALAKDRWVSRLNTDDECDQEVDILWYYFDKNGKMVKYRDDKPEKKYRINTLPKADGYYFFDSDGHMISGWYDLITSDGEERTYYLGEGDDGRMRTEWQKLEPREDTEPEYNGQSYDTEVWYYFAWDGIQVKAEEKKINKSYYQFDENGVMMTGWYPGIAPQDVWDPSSDEPISLNRYYSKETGARMENCWVYAYQQEDYDETEDQYWYYLGKKGEVFNEGGKDAYRYLDGAEVAIKRIGSYYYGFDNMGRMITGLIDTRTDRSDENEELMQDEYQDLTGMVASVTKQFEDGGIFYFEDRDPASLGRMQTGKQKLNAISGAVEYRFRDNGQAYTSTMIDGKVYGPDGRLVKGDGQKEVIRLACEIYAKNADVDEDEPLIPYNEPFIVSSSGTVKKSGSVTIEGTKYQVERYIATEISD